MACQGNQGTVVAAATTVGPLLPRSGGERPTPLAPNFRRIYQNPAKILPELATGPAPPDFGPILTKIGNQKSAAKIESKL